MWPNGVSNPGPLTYETGALPTALRSPASYRSVISEYLLPLIPCTGAVSRYFTLTEVIYKQKKLGYFQTVFIVSKVQPCILVSFVFKLSLGLVGGGDGQTGTSVNSLEDCVVGKGTSVNFLKRICILILYILKLLF